MEIGRARRPGGRAGGADPGGRPGHRRWRGLEARGRELKMDWDKRDSKRRGERCREMQRDAEWQRERQRQKFGEIET